MSNKILIIKEEINYQHRFENDKVNFLNGDLFRITGTTKKWVVLTNFHGTVEVNVSPNHVPGMRTLSWANPFEYSRYLFLTLADSHNYSALLLDWATKPGGEAENKRHQNFRDQVTFMLIPPEEAMTFMIGFASPQDEESVNKNKPEDRKEEIRDKREGGGVQLRLGNIPVGTIIIQCPLKLKKSETMEGGKERKVYDFESTYEMAMETLEANIDQLVAESGIETSIPANIFMPKHKIYTTLDEDFDVAEMEKKDITYLKQVIEKFDVAHYIRDYWRVDQIEEVALN